MHRHDVHVDPIEAQEVVRLAAERQSAVPDNGPTVNGLAEALGLPREEIERLLAEVRGQRGVAVPVERRRVFGDRSAALSAALALLLFVVTACFGLAFYQMRSAPPPPEVAKVVDLGPGHEGFDVLPPTLVPGAPVMPAPDTIIVQSEADRKRQEIAEIAEQIARIHAEESMANAEKSHADLDRTLNELRKELEQLKKDKASVDR